MRRHAVAPRPNWQQIVSTQGLPQRSDGELSSWDETAWWQFSADEADRLKRAVATLQAMCIEAAQYALNRRWLPAMGIPSEAAAVIERAWSANAPSLYGRMDLAFDGRSIKLLEYHADTPTLLLEAAVLQRQWLNSCFPHATQWNNLPEQLIARWGALAPQLTKPVYFSHDGAEGEPARAYLRETARQAGLTTETIAIRDVRWDHERRVFLDRASQPVATLVKLYPWEWLLRDEVGPHALESMGAAGQQPGRTQWIEPISKMLWSNQALLALLWELYPDHPLLLPAFLDGPHEMRRYVRKPLLGAEGANVTLVEGTRRTETPGPHTEGPWLYHRLAPVPCVEGNWTVIGGWLVGGEPAGMGVRESTSRIGRHADRFVPHAIIG